MYGSRVGQLSLSFGGFEVALIEYGTFRFDLARARDLGLAVSMLTDPERDDASGEAGDLAYFLDGFGHRQLARDLLTLFEHARLRIRLANDYPGLVRRGLPIFQAEYRARQAQRPEPDFLGGVYAHLALDLPLAEVRRDLSDGLPTLRRMQAAFTEASPSRIPVEASAGLAAALFSDVQGNPIEANVNAGLEAYREGGHDGIVAFGGGRWGGLARGSRQRLHPARHIPDHVLAYGVPAQIIRKRKEGEQYLK